MNRAHRWLCGSAGWRGIVSERLLPWVLEGVPPGGHLLEIGPGPGAATPTLRRHASHLTCVEIDVAMARSLARTHAGSNVTVTCGDAAALSSRGASMDVVVCMTMLHHVPSQARQDQVFREAARVLRAGGRFVGSDGVGSVWLRCLHLGATYVPVDPSTLRGRLESAGFTDVRVDVRGRMFRFQATRRAADLP